MESKRLAKVSQMLEQELSKILQAHAQNQLKGVLLSVTKVRLSPDIGYAKVYISIFPTTKTKEVMDDIELNAWQFKNALTAAVGKHMRIIPNLSYYNDDSLEYEEKIDKLLRGEGENPIQ